MKWLALALAVVASVSTVSAIFETNDAARKVQFERDWQETTCRGLVKAETSKCDARIEAAVSEARKNEPMRLLFRPAKGK